MGEITPELRERFSIGQDVKGVAITAIAEGTPAGEAAAENRIRVGDVIMEVGQQEVATPQDVADKVAAAEASQTRVLLVTLNRGGEVSFSAIRLGD